MNTPTQRSREAAEQIVQVLRNDPDSRFVAHIIQAASDANNGKAQDVSKTVEERGLIYGEPELSHENIGLAWTGLLQQHYGLRLDHPLPAWLVELMMAAFKIHRAARVFHEDNYMDLEAYALRFAKEHQRKAFSK